MSFKANELGVASLDTATGEYSEYFTERMPQNFHGTGDIWASTLCGALVNGKSFEEAIRIACDYVRECIHVTLAEENHNTYGVNFEQAIPYLIQRLNG